MPRRTRAGCWHYDYTQFCTQCDPASYGACEASCPYDHEHCTCPAECSVHEEEGEQ